MPRYATIIGTGHYLPEHEVSNNDLRVRFDATVPEFVNKMEASSNIKTRFYAPREWALSDLAARAGQDALKAAGITARAGGSRAASAPTRRTTSRPPPASSRSTSSAPSTPARSTSAAPVPASPPDSTSPPA